MTALAAPLPKPPALAARLPFYYGWVNVVVAALAMVATLPGRTQGLGLITEPLLQDLNLDRVAYAQINLWATLLGSAACLGFGGLEGIRRLERPDQGLLADGVFAGRQHSLDMLKVEKGRGADVHNLDIVARQ